MSILWFIASSVLLIPSIAYGAEGNFFTMNLLWSAINFIIMVAGFVYLYKRFHGTEMFKKRKNGIEKLINEAEDLKQRATKRYNDAAEQLNSFEQTRKEIMDDMRKNTEKEKQTISAEGNAMIERLKKESGQLVEGEVEKAKEMITEEVRKQIYLLTKEHIERSIDKDSQEKITDTFIRNLK